MHRLPPSLVGVLLVAVGGANAATQSAWEPCPETEARSKDGTREKVVCEITAGGSIEVHIDAGLVPVEGDGGRSRLYLVVFKDGQRYAVLKAGWRPGNASAHATYFGDRTATYRFKLEGTAERARCLSPTIEVRKATSL